MTNAKTLAVYGNYVNGTWKNSTETLPVFDKFTGEEIAKVAIATREEVTEAIDNAYETFQTSKLSPAQRSEILLKVVEIVRKRKEELALTITQETGKSLKKQEAKSIVEFRL